MKDLIPIEPEWTPAQNVLANDIRQTIHVLSEVHGMTVPQAEAVLTEIMHEMDVYDEAQTNRGREATVGGQ